MNTLMNCLNFVVEAINVLFVLCIHVNLFIDDTVRQIKVYRRNNNTCIFTDHLKFIDHRIKQQSLHTFQVEKQTFESLCQTCQTKTKNDRKRQKSCSKNDRNGGKNKSTD